ncbi:MULTISPECIES: DUF1674 domain-containing protein [Lysobacter]|uniref:DUF1674 domain-containing protein n=1 Tax=Lysobacter TaxID=68 RepID=UPI002E12660D
MGKSGRVAAFQGDQLLTGQGECLSVQGLRVVRHGGRDLIFNAVMIGETTPEARSDLASENPATPVTETGGHSPSAKDAPKEHGGREGLEPTRYGDWEKNGRCIDF